MIWQPEFTDKTLSRETRGGSNTLSSSILRAPSDNVLTGKNQILYDFCVIDL
ncbi:hypothetical protein HT118_17150 [Escherichia coli]|nr:hypothetical protein [Escherichia coli]